MISLSLRVIFFYYSILVDCLFVCCACLLPVTNMRIKVEVEVEGNMAITMQNMNCVTNVLTMQNRYKI